MSSNTLPVEAEKISPIMNTPSAKEEASNEPAIAQGEITDAGAMDLGHSPQLVRNRSLSTLLFQCIAIAAVPYGAGSPLMSAIYGGGPLAMFVGWIVTLCFEECVALSLGEFASLYPTSSGPYYWSFQLLLSLRNKERAGVDYPTSETHSRPTVPRSAVIVAYISGWVLLVGTWAVVLSVNFGFASLLSASINMFQPDFMLDPWMLLLIFYALCLVTLVICTIANSWLPQIDTVCAAWTLMSVFIIMIALAITAKRGRRSASEALGSFDNTLSGWGDFCFFVGMLPGAYAFSGLGLICSMAEECDKPRTQVPTAMSLSIPIAGAVALFFMIPIAVTMPPLEEILAAPGGQALPLIFKEVMGSPAGAMGLMILVLGVAIFCSLSITVVASRYTWAFARDNGIPGAWWSKVHPKLGIPVNALCLVTVVQMLLALISLGNTSAFNAFVSMSVIALQFSYGIPIAVSLWGRRREVAQAVWRMPNILGWVVNVVALLWILFECFLFSMPVTKHVENPEAMNYASVALVGFGVLAAAWYGVHAHKVFNGPPCNHNLG